MGKKIKAEMDAQRARFIEGAKANGVPAAQAEFIFNLVDKFAGYGFNKSHAAAYALVAWQTAFLKCHHPAAFFAATMAYDIHATDKLAVLVDDMRRLGVPLLPPCINASGADFTLESLPDGRVAVRYALGALKGVGEGAMADLVAEREANGPFASLDDLVHRIDPRALNRRQMEVLAAAGAFDCFGVDRARAYAGAEHLMAAAARAAEARATGQGGLFGGDSVAEAVPLPHVPAWSLAERLSHEHEAFGLWFSGHPVEAHSAVLAAQQAATGAEVQARRAPAGTRTTVRMAGLVEAVRWRTPQGAGPDKRYLLVDLSDQGGKWGASCFAPEAQQALQEGLASADPLLLDVELQWREGDEAPRLAIQSARPLAGLARTARALLAIRLAPEAGPSLVPDLVRLLPRGGRSIVEAAVPLAAGGEAIVRLGSDFELPPGVEALLRALPGIADATVTAAGPPLRLVA
jgi:DNA polymerase-3 subunit alpha